MLFGVYLLYMKCVPYKDGKKTCLKSMKEKQATFGGMTVPRCSLNSSVFSIILIFLVLMMTQATIAVEEPGRVRSPSFSTAFDRVLSVNEPTVLR
jgi:hypothetical protein